MVVTANNHSIDLGTHGVDRTLLKLKEFGLQPLGTKEKEEESNFIIEEINGIKVGMIAYTYETPEYNKRKTINALVIPKDVLNRINTFSYEKLDASLEKMQNEILMMRSLGAEVILFYMHWGNEYQLKPSSYQVNIAQALSNYGVDIVLGSHPHVIQPMEFIKSEETDKITLVVYSMGNILSNQRYEILKNRHSEDGIIVNIDLRKDLQTGEINFNRVTYIPTWVYKYNVKGKTFFEILPLNPDPEKIEALYDIKGEGDKWRAKNSRKNTILIIPTENRQNIPIELEEVIISRHFCQYRE